MNKNNESNDTVPTIRIRAAGDAHVVAFSVPVGSILKVDGVEVV